MKNFFKRTVVFISSIVFCFTPLLFAGCDLSFSDNGYGDMQSDFNVNHYLTGLKVAYSANFNPNTTDEKLIKLKNEILANNLLIAKDIMVNLLSVYGTGINEEFSIVQKDLLNPLNVLATINYTQEDESVKTPLSQNVIYTVEEVIPPQQPEDEETTVDVNYAYVSNQFTSYQNSNTSTNGNRWKLFYDTTIDTLEDSQDIYKLSYVILYILNNFDKVTSADLYTQAYSQLLNDYDSKISSSANFEYQCNQIALSVNHTSITPDSYEQQALYQFILDRVIGSNIVNTDNVNFKVYNGERYISATTNDKFNGDVYYYLNNDDEQQIIDDYFATMLGDYKGISLYLSGVGDINTKLDEIYTQTGIKLYQDIDNNNKANVLFYGNTSYPLYQPSKYFKNYTNTVNKLVDNVLKNNHVKFEDREELQTYENLANVLSKDYTFNQVQASTDDSAENSIIPQFSYKNIVFCASNKTNNNIGTIMMLIESAVNVPVDLSLYVRYYRQGEGYAYFNDYQSTFYPVNADSDKKPEQFHVEGPSKLEYNEATGEFDEGCFIELNVHDIISKSIFGGVENNKKFQYKYEGFDGESTKEIYSIEPFPVNYCNPEIIPNVITGGPNIASVFTKASKDNQKYKEVLGPNNEKLVTYDFENISTQTGCGYIEILFATSNDNYFTFGLTGYMPQTELLF